MAKMRIVSLKVVNLRPWHPDNDNLDEENEATDAGSCCPCQLSLCHYVLNWLLKRQATCAYCAQYALVHF